MDFVDFVCNQLDELKTQFLEKHKQYSNGDPLANFRVGALLNGRGDNYAAMYEEAKAYAAKHIAHVYAHNIDGVKVDESLKDIAIYSIIELFIVEASKQEQKAYRDSNEYRNMLAEFGKTLKGVKEVEINE